MPCEITMKAVDKKTTWVEKVLLVFIGLLAVTLIILSLSQGRIKRNYHWSRERSAAGTLATATCNKINETNAKDILSILRTVTDPELGGIDIVSLGLIYDVAVENNRVNITMTLTTPRCPFIGQLIEDIKKAVFAHPGVDTVDLHITLEPAWTLDRLVPEAREKIFSSFRHNKEVSHE
jgi:metal-sulfur cluster biosynthetic enzyme